MINSKVLLKDLPFDCITKGTVLSEYNGSFIIERGETWCDSNIGGSHNGHTVFDESANSIIEAIWENPDWFEPTRLTPIRYSRTNKSITLSFDTPLCLTDIESITQGIQRTLNNHYRNTVKEMGWTDEKINVIFRQQLTKRQER